MKSRRRRRSSSLLAIQPTSRFEMGSEWELRIEFPNHMIGMKQIQPTRIGINQQKKVVELDELEYDRDTVG